MVLRVARGPRVFPSFFFFSAQPARERERERERNLRGTFPILPCVSERKERDSDAAECRFSPGRAASSAFSSRSLRGVDPRFVASSFEIIVVRTS